MKTYIKPEIEVLKIQLVNMIAVSGGGELGPEIVGEIGGGPSGASVKEMIGFDFDENNFLPGDDFPIF